MYFSADIDFAIVSRLSSTCAAVTLGPKQYHEHQPVGGSFVFSGGWFSASRIATACNNAERSGPDATNSSSRRHDSPGASVSPSQSTTARTDDADTSNRPLNRTHDVNA